MGKVSKNQSGYSTVEVILLAVIVLLIGFIGWYVYNASNNAYDTYNSTPNSNVAPHKKGTVTTTKTTTPAASSTSSTTTTSTAANTK